MALLGMVFLIQRKLTGKGSVHGCIQGLDPALVWAH